MDPYALQLQASMTNEQRIAFQGEYFGRRKDPAVGVLFAVFLGSFGAHQFYLGQNVIAIFYLVFFWTGIPGLIALEAFFMPSRVRRWNDQLAAETANKVLQVSGQLPMQAGANAFCTHCGKPIANNAQFCAICGSAVAAAVAK